MPYFLYDTSPNAFALAVGRMVIDKGIDLVAKKTGLPMEGEYHKDTETWLIRVGQPGAAMQATLHLTNDALSSLLEEIVPDLVQERPILRDRILALLQKYLCVEGDSCKS